MTPPEARRTVLTLAIGALGAALATMLDLPAAPLIGASLSVSAAAWSGLSLGVDTRLRDASFLVIGLSLGSGFDPQTLAHANEWLLSLGALFLSILSTVFVCRWLLVRFWGFDRQTALLATSPGAMSLALSIAAEGKGDLVAVTVLQSMRLLLLAAALPLIIAYAGAAPAGAAATARLGVGVVAAIGLAGLTVALLLKRMGFPAAFLVGGMAASGLAHSLDLARGFPPQALLFAGFCVAGSVIGSRFSGVRARTILDLAWPAVASIAAAALIAALAAAFLSAATGLAPAQVWIAFAPGGVEAMAAIGLAMGFDPAYVALHHLVRITVLIILTPLLAARRP